VVGLEMARCKEAKAPPAEVAELIAAAVKRLRRGARKRRPTPIAEFLANPGQIVQAEINCVLITILWWRFLCCRFDDGTISCVPPDPVEREP
jgi:hypothetical protein